MTVQGLNETARARALSLSLLVPPSLEQHPLCVVHRGPAGVCNSLSRKGDGGEGGGHQGMPRKSRQVFLLRSDLVTPRELGNVVQVLRGTVLSSDSGVVFYREEEENQDGGDVPISGIVFET